MSFTVTEVNSSLTVPETVTCALLLKSPARFGSMPTTGTTVSRCTVMLWAPALSAGSTARTERVLSPSARVTPERVKPPAVFCAGVPLTVTEAVGSSRVPDTVTVGGFRYWSSFCEVILTTGRTVSSSTLTAAEAAPVFPAASVAVAVKLFAPSARATPPIS